MKQWYIVERMGDPKDWMVALYQKEPGQDVARTLVATCSSEAWASKVRAGLEALESKNDAKT